ncbi:hypothetical protein CSB09_03535 [Candidatus Gracilibacteria bacterium]|nr:MAG: hypothetical protein CSB09_03535 [Candidatus Gracilibacteria bacterium]
MESKVLTGAGTGKPVEIENLQLEEWIGKGGRSSGVHLISASLKNRMTQLVEKRPNEQLCFVPNIAHILRTHQICKELKIPTFPTLRTDGTNLYSTPFFKPGKYELLTANNYAKRLMYLQLEGNLRVDETTLSVFESSLYNNTKKQGVIINNLDAFGFVTDVKKKEVIKIIICDFDCIENYQEDSSALDEYSGKYRDIINTNLYYFRQSLQEMKKYFNIDIEGESL